MPRNQNVHTNSRQGYAQLIASGSINNLKTHIYKLLSDNPPMTDKQIASRLGRLITSVRPRISDMVNNEHVLFECGETKEDGKTVRVVRIAIDEDSEIIQLLAKARNDREEEDNARIRGSYLLGIKSSYKGVQTVLDDNGDPYQAHVTYITLLGKQHYIHIDQDAIDPGRWQIELMTETMAAVKDILRKELK